MIEPTAVHRPRLLPAVLGMLLAACALGGQDALAAPGWSWPVSGEVITPYGNGSDPYAAGQHRGIDIAARAGTPVVAAAGGTVRFAGVAGSSGLTVSIRTADGRFDTSYLHLSAADVAEGQTVRAGRRLGAVGTSGRRSATAPHLHFGVREAGARHAYRDPLDFLAPPAAAPAPKRPPVPVVAPVRRPVAVRQAPRPLRVPLRPRVPRRGPGRARAPRPLPASRRIRVPAGGRAPFPGLSPAPRPAPVAARGRVPARRSHPGRAPAGGPAPVAAPGGAPVRAAADSSPKPAPAHGGGPDLGWALACLGLLLAAACLGRPRSDGPGSARASGAIGSVLRPLLGGRR